MPIPPTTPTPRPLSFKERDRVRMGENYFERDTDTHPLYEPGTSFTPQTGDIVYSHFGLIMVMVRASNTANGNWAK